MALAEGIRIEQIDSNDDPDLLLDNMLLDGKIDAVIGPNVLPSITARDPRMRRLFRDFRKEEQEYYRKTKIFPTSHIVTLKRAFVDKHPNAPVALLKGLPGSRVTLPSTVSSAPTRK